MITTAKQSSILQNFPKYRSMLAGNSAYVPPAFESIMTVSGSGSSGTVTLSAIPSTYTHLQLRWIGRQTQSGRSDNAAIWLTFNSDSGANYAYQNFLGYPSSTSVQSQQNQNYIALENSLTRGASTTNNYGVGVLDILDYTNTSKWKAVRSFQGVNQNTADNGLALTNGQWRSTSAITSITITEQTGFGNLTTLSNFALYGIKTMA